MVCSNGFCVKIITDTDQDKLRREGYNYVALYNNTEYKIQLINDRSTDAMADVYIEGENIGTWFIPAHEDIVIERPADTARRFTFFKETDTRAVGAGVTPGESLNGVIRVVFYPKKQYIAISPRRISQPFLESTLLQPSISPLPTTVSLRPETLSRTVSLPQYQSGATVLGQQSYQTFGSMRRFSDNEIDWNNKTEIIIRLIVKPKKNEFIKMTEARSPGMYQQRFISIKSGTSQIPPRIDNYRPAI